jgi:S-methylmethionine-dependent homocysteine/selenocysteine methylase
MAARLLTDSGLETWLLFHKGIDLPDFASFPLLEDDGGRAALAEYFLDHLRVADQAGTGIVLETPTWRASADWGGRLGYDAAALDRANRGSVALLRELGAEVPGVDLSVSGNFGPRGDGYDPAELLAPDDAEAYHRAQAASFAAEGADRLTMLTCTHVGEGIGFVRAAAATGLPVTLSFTVETDGRLPSGQPLAEAIEEVDAATDGVVASFGLNCAHPDHFDAVLDPSSPAIGRLGLLRSNASRMSHAELDEAEELDDGDPEELGGQYAALIERLPNLQVLGGCCGTDVRHVHAIAAACV